MFNLFAHQFWRKETDEIQEKGRRGTSPVTQQMAADLTWEICWWCVTPKYHEVFLFYFIYFFTALMDVEHCWTINGQHSVSGNNGPIISQTFSYKLREVYKSYNSVHPGKTLFAHY
ncbi:hypothetical protein ATANTOWER_003933 [Ataeniobius toweri]|uniref:Uncharacterized protein n=1 Tax=Ataeniobius toweri TaxID=208326 RepID=A0ABU7A1M2_9TELE|nr:hypothetical protein [Ataeniobius toweri]